MRFHVQVSIAARQDVQAIHDHIARDKRNAAAKWVHEFNRQAKSLALLPFRYEIMPEAEAAGRPWRHIYPWKLQDHLSRRWPPSDSPPGGSMPPNYLINHS